MAKLYFRYGAMGSSKTANAIMVQYNYHERGQNALMIKPRLDNRDGERIVGSRSGLSAPCIYMEEIDTVDLSTYNCIIVDEAQFLTRQQVEQLVHVVDVDNVPVIAYGLRADFQGNLFEGSQCLLAWADTIEEVIPHFLNPVATYILGRKLENSPIYGILSKETQSSVIHLYFIFAFG